MCATSPLISRIYINMVQYVYIYTSWKRTKVLHISGKKQHSHHLLLPEQSVQERNVPKATWGRHKRVQHVILSRVETLKRGIDIEHWYWNINIIVG